MLKVDKKTKTVILLFYPGGVKAQLETTHTIEEATSLLRKRPEVVLDTIDNNENILDEKTIVYTDKLLFANVLVPNDNAIRVAGPNEQRLEQRRADNAVLSDGILKRS